MFSLSCWLLLLSSIPFAVSAHKRAAKRQDGSPSPFVSVATDGSGKLMANGSTFTYLGTTAYWLSSLNTLEDIDATLGNISQAGFNSVRTWAFNDVDTIPENGTWFQSVQNGSLVVNNGTNGLQKLDAVMDLAQKHGIYVLLSLTNNWNPRPTDNATVTDPLSGFRFGKRDMVTNNSLPRGALSNDYGGMDFYVRNLGGPQEHDQFFVNQTVINAFKNYTAQIVTRYANHPNVLAWELANDPRCNSSVPASPGCIAQHVTLWHSDIAQHVKQHDPNHLVSTGHQGFFCTGCPKLFPLVTPPRPQPSPAPGARRRSPKAAPLTRERIFLERKASLKRSRAVAQQTKAQSEAGAIRIRGRWISTPTRRQQDSGLGSAFDGSQGVDSEDIINIPQVDFGSFSLFPDQNSYGVADPNLPPFNNTVAQGLDWISKHAETGRLFGKPMTMTGFGLVTQGNSQAFVPFNSTQAPFAPDANATAAAGGPIQQPYGVTDEQRDDAYNQWLQAGVVGGLQGMIQYQWSQSGLTPQDGTVVSTAETATGTGTVDTTTGMSPNDGYGIQGLGQTSLVQSIQGATQGFVPVQPPSV